jgi:uncharacterized protein
MNAMYSSPEEEKIPRTASKPYFGEPGMNYLCAGWKAFFHYIDSPMQILAGLIVGAIRLRSYRIFNMGGAFTRARSNGLRHCGSGRKFKHFHGYHNGGSEGKIHLTGQ